MADSILTSPELDYIIENMKLSKLDEIGTIYWFKERDKLCKLYQVTILEADTPPSEERVKSSFVSHGNIQTFVKELITISVWRMKVLPELCKFSPIPEQVIPTYIIFYSEQLILSILEAILFHEELFWDLGDSSLDVIDYSVSQLIHLDTKAAFDIKELSLSESDTLKVISDYITHFNCCESVSCLSILRYTAENLDKLPLSSASKLYTTHDLPVVIAHLLDKEVWTIRHEGKIYKFVENKWKEWLPSDPVLSKVECQTWLLLRQLLLNSTVDTVYSFTYYRKEVLSKLLRLLHDSVVDQLSPLAELKLWLHQLSLTAPKDTVSNPIILEINSSYQDTLLMEYNGKWNEIARKSVNLLFYPRHNDLKDIVHGFANGLDGLVEVAENCNSCAVCFAKALKRCSKCHKVWYCSRKCQVNHWEAHKSLCSV